MTTVPRIELMAALSLATDLGLGSPLESGLATCLVATRFAKVLGLAVDDAHTVYHLALLRHIGCTAGNHELAAAFGSEMGLHELMGTVDFSDPEQLEVALAGYARASIPADRRPALTDRLPAVLPLIGETTSGACEVATMLARRFGYDGSLQAALLVFYERWDGCGIPGRLDREAVPLAVRVVQVAEAAVRARARSEDVSAWIRRRAGSTLDPGLAARFADEPGPLLAVLDTSSRWDAVVALEPAPRRSLSGAELDTALRAVGEFADLKSPWLVGHSVGVAELADGAAVAAGLPPAQVSAVRRAAWIHDLGRVAVSAGVWARPGALTRDEWERVRLHPYHTDRVLDGARSLQEVREIAALHHERLDGSGYTRGLPAGLLPFGARLLAAADVYAAMTEARAHRPAIDRDAAVRALRAESRAGRVDGRAAEAVLEAAGHRPRRRTEAVAGLTAREIEVLGLLARGNSNREIAGALVAALKTVDSHVQRIYAKVGVSTRAGATLFAMQHGLVGPAERIPVGQPRASSQ